jgi:hypothetical protein
MSLMVGSVFRSVMVWSKSKHIRNLGAILKLDLIMFVAASVAGGLIARFRECKYLLVEYFQPNSSTNGPNLRGLNAESKQKRGKEEEEWQNVELLAKRVLGDEQGSQLAHDEGEDHHEELAGRGQRFTRIALFNHQSHCKPNIS